jgi:hypothetical protein
MTARLAAHRERAVMHRRTSSHLEAEHVRRFSELK